MNTDIQCYVIFDEKGKPLRNGISFNNEDEAWRVYFSNRAGWEKLRDLAMRKKYSCTECLLIIAT